MNMRANVDMASNIIFLSKEVKVNVDMANNLSFLKHMMLRYAILDLPDAFNQMGIDLYGRY